SATRPSPRRRRGRRGCGPPSPRARLRDPPPGFRREVVRSRGHAIEFASKSNQDTLRARAHGGLLMAAARWWTVDADGHVLEPRDTWQKYLEPKYRADAIRIEK